MKVYDKDKNLLFKRKVFTALNANGEVHVAAGDVK